MSRLHTTPTLATQNRIPAYDVPPPADVTGRHDVLSDAIPRPVAAVTRLLDSDDPSVVLKSCAPVAVGDLFVFKTRRIDKPQVLSWRGDGFALYLRRVG